MPRGYNQIDEASIQNILWTPDVFKPAIWLDSSDLSTITMVGSGVSQWRDKSGNDCHYAQSTSTLRPTYEYTIPDARGTVVQTPQSGVRFQNTGTTRQWMDTSSFVYAGNQMQMFSVHRNQSTAAAPNQYGRIFSFTLNSGTNDYNNTAGLILVYGSTTNGISLYRNSAIIASSSENVNNLWIIANARRNAGTGRISINGGSYVTGTTSTTNQNIAYSRIGNDISTVDSGMNGWLCENILYTTELSDAQCQLVEGYLAWKWGLQNLLIATHPFANRPPLKGD